MQTEGRKKALRAFLFALASTLAIDQATKAVVRIALPQEGGQLRLVGDFLVLRQHRNPGISFGLLEGGNRYVLLLMAAIPAFLLFLYAWSNGEKSTVSLIGAGLICGGAMGNIIDRLVFGKVIDFIDPSFWPSFNVADAAVVVGMGFFVAGHLRHGLSSGRRSKKRPNGEET